MRKKRKFDATTFLNEKYIRGEYAIIPMQVESIDDFYNKFDSSKNTLEPELASYIDKCAYNIPINYKLILKISCPNLTEEDKKEIERLIKIHYGLIVHDKNLDLKINEIDVLWLSVLGVIVLALTYFFGEQLQSFLKEILLIAGWFAIWESVDKFVLGRRKIRIDKRNAKQLFDSEIYYEVNEKEVLENKEGM